jgi:hypothetical protein
MLGERWFVALIGPLAIDGAMIGCTMALLFTRAQPAIAPGPVDVDAVLSKWAVDEQPEELPVPVSPMVGAMTPLISSADVPISWAPMNEQTQPDVPAEQPRERKRASKEQLEAAVLMLLDGVLSVPDIAEKTTVGASTLLKYDRARRVLRDNIHAELVPEVSKGLRPEMIALMRQELRMERAR